MQSLHSESMAGASESSRKQWCSTQAVGCCWWHRLLLALLV